MSYSDTMGNNRGRGRPMNDDIGEALTRAASEILIEHGSESLSLNAVVLRAKTTRPTFYRRYSGIPELLLDVVQQRLADAPAAPDTGTLAEDLLAIQRAQVELYTDELVRAALGGFLHVVASDPEIEAKFIAQVLEPRRADIREALQRATDRDEIPVPDDPEWICDLLIAPLHLRSSYPGMEPLDERLIVNTTRVALRELGWEGQLPSPPPRPQP